MSEPAIITVAITGAVPTTKDNAAVPVTPEQQVASAVEAFRAGATVCHVHVRDEHERPSSDPQRYEAVRAGIQRECPEMVVQFSTGARGRSIEERFACLELRPEMASFATGSVNFPNQIYENPPAVVEDIAPRFVALGIRPEIEVFDLAMLYKAADLVHREQLAPAPHVQLVMGIKNALPPRESLVEFFAAEVAELIPGATWGCMATGRFQLAANRWALARGGHVRTGLEDNLYYDKGRLAASNAELVARAAGLCAEYGRHPASPAETRRLLHVSTVGALS
ncbi:3-keto-5-aminohexanoate cleavage protein [Amycolatopsis sp. K13G38]|uniref:3-keto-5-aminohexanoate cleavage protein n=1 Tax=Amycolatopsis acididurans TaxID=2724524 RepID=A0ABX1IXT4_9PSEU|nr:3-keto-5-aminohexanoate cleavage protein [Amycolatopsis acididurans]NKQ52302.1 3-keto-5-aminohexanoate cleavage protein [Amycolatopsis acididurans]